MTIAIETPNNLNGLSGAHLGAGFLDIVSGIVSGASGTSTAGQFVAEQQAIAAQHAATESRKTTTAIALGGVALVGLGLFAWMMLKK